MRMIDADALESNGICFAVHGGAEFISLDSVRTAPTIDAVPVVRCGECERRKKSADLTASVWCKWYVCEMPKDGFCSYGERKEGNDEDR